MKQVRVIDAGWVTVGEAAQASGYSEEYIRQLARRGGFESVRLGRDWLVNLEAVLAYRREMQALGTAKHNPKRKKSLTASPASREAEGSDSAAAPPPAPEREV